MYYLFEETSPHTNARLYTSSTSPDKTLPSYFRKSGKVTLIASHEDRSVISAMRQALLEKSDDDMANASFRQDSSMDASLRNREKIVSEREKEIQDREKVVGDREKRLADYINSLTNQSGRIEAVEAPDEEKDIVQDYAGQRRSLFKQEKKK